jgi:hypothetical protein
MVDGRKEHAVTIRRIICVLVLLIGAFAHAREVAALTITPNPVDLFSGQLQLIGVVTGLPSGGVIQFGTVDGNDPTLLFQVSVVEDASDLTLSPAVFVDTFFAGGGTIPAANFDVTLISPAPGTARIQELIPAGALTDIFFLSLSAYEVGDGVSVRVDFPGNLVGTGFTIVPEPSAGVLLGAGLCALTTWRRRGSRTTARHRS